MNSIPANELKRHGIAVIEKLLAKGPVHVIKRNHPVCVVLSEKEYERLVGSSSQKPATAQLSVADWFALPAIGNATKEELDLRLQDERASWGEA